MNMILRPDYLNWLNRWKNQQIIKVVTGVRRCGKSTLFEMFQQDLKQQGVADNQLISINFENLEYENLLEYKALYQYLKQRIPENGTCYIFLDEIQHVNGYEKVVDSLFIDPRCDIYMTGSNGYFMSGELATLLTGRYVALEMMPLSFHEFCQGLPPAMQGMTNSEKMNQYMQIGSFPYVLRYNYSVKEANEYMSGIYHTILLNDVVKRLNIADVNMLETVTRFLMDNIGNRTSPTTIANTMTSMQRKIDAKTVDRYLRGLTDSLLFYEARRYNIKGKQLMSSINKYYVCDVALRSLLVRSRSEDMGHILENIVYLELRRRYDEVYVGQMDQNGEIDFVAFSNGSPTYVQVSQTTLDETVLTREIAPLKQIKDNYPKLLLTLDEVFADVNYDGIQKKNVLKWMLSEN